jgi:hypothetical protein
MCGALRSSKELIASMFVFNYGDTSHLASADNDGDGGGRRGRRDRGDRGDKTRGGARDGRGGRRGRGDSEGGRGDRNKSVPSGRLMLQKSQVEVRGKAPNLDVPVEVAPASKIRGPPLPVVSKPAHRPRRDGSRLTILHVAEKPLIASTLARALSNGQASERRGIVTPVHEFDHLFQGQLAHFRVTSVTGHVYGVALEAGFEWGRVHPAELFSAPLMKEPADKKGHMCRHLQNEARGVDYLVSFIIIIMIFIFLDLRFYGSTATRKATISATRLSQTPKLG